MYEAEGTPTPVIRAPRRRSPRGRAILRGVDLLDLLNAPPRERRSALDRWRASRPAAHAAEDFVRDFVPLFDRTDAVAFLDAEGLWEPLGEMAQASSGRTASTLWAWAATSSWVVGDWADAPCQYAVRALRADPTNEEAWQVFADVVSSYAPPELAADVRAWADDPRMGSAVAARAEGLLDETP